MFLRKIILLISIFVTSVFPILFVKFNEPNFRLNIYIFLAKTGSLCGTILILWQFLLGFRQVFGKIIRDLLWVFRVHQVIGKYVLFIILLHPIFITLYYFEEKGINLLVPMADSSFYTYVLTGKVAILLFLVIVLTSIFLRNKLGHTLWYTFHISSYIALPLVLVHSIAIGRTINNTSLGAIWKVLVALTVAFFVFRLLCRLGLLSKEHKVNEVEAVGPGVVKITCSPISSRVEPKLGQFIYFRRGFWGNIRPFTVSHYDNNSGKISVTVKAKGKTTHNLQKIKPSERVYIEGPYGVFSHTALKSNKPIVMVAGGIGITPFVRLFEELAYEPDRELHLFYGNRRKHEIVYKEELENSEHVNTVHVLSDEKVYDLETGYISTELIKKYVGDLKKYEFLICGPPIMTIKLESALKQEGVRREQIHHELFSY